MGGVCMCSARTCRPVWSVFVILASVPCMLSCLETPAVAVGKMYPRGNHWAVGHLMGKKSIETLPELQRMNRNHHTPPDTDELTELDLMEALMQQKYQKQTMPQTADGLLRPRSGWRDEDRDKYLREMSDLLLLALKLQDNDFN